MKWKYYYNDRWGTQHPTNFRRTNGYTYQQLKDQVDWGPSERHFLQGSILVPDLLLILKDYPL